LVQIARLLAGLSILASVAYSIYGLAGNLELETGDLVEGFLVRPLLIICYAVVGALASMVVRYRRAGETERLQMRWLFYPIGIAINWWLLIEPAVRIVSEPLGDRIAELGLIPFYLMALAIPLAIAAAILRYRLFDIGLIIRRTLAGFAQTARNETDLEALTAKLVAVVRTTMRPETVQVWLVPAAERAREAGRGGV
jgi:hypothetical protein